MHTSINCYQIDGIVALVGETDLSLTCLVRRQRGSL